MALVHWLQVLNYVWSHHDLGADDSAITMEEMATKLNEKYILIKRGDAYKVIFIEGAIPPEGTLTCDIQPVDPDRVQDVIDDENKTGVPYSL